MSYVDVKDRAKKIRKTLKREYGWNAKQVSVRISRYSMGQSINVTIKDQQVPGRIVKAVAQDQESIDRCPASGEILSGGNTFVFVDYDYDALLDLADLLADELAGIDEAKGGWILGELIWIGTDNGAWASIATGSDMTRAVSDVTICEGWRELMARRLARQVAHEGILSGWVEERETPSGPV